jgi:hypothetical protein
MSKTQIIKSYIFKAEKDIETATEKWVKICEEIYQFIKNQISI